MTLHFYLGTDTTFIPTHATDLGNQNVRLGQLTGLIERAENGIFGSGQITLDDTSGVLSIPGLRPFWVDESAASPSRIFTGFLADRTFKRGTGTASPSLITGTQRLIDCTLVDLNAVFKLRVLTSSASMAANRPAETDVERVTWLLSVMSPTIYDNGQVTSSDPRNMPATDYRGMFPVDVLEDCVGTANRNYFAYWDTSAQQISLYYRPGTDGATYASSLRLTNVLADVDNSVTWAANASQFNDPSDVYSGIYYIYHGGRVYVQNPTTAAAFIPRDTTSTTGASPSKALATERATNILAARSLEYIRITADAHLPASHVNDALVGQHIMVKFPDLDGYTVYTDTQIVARTVAMTDETDQLYDVTYELAVVQSATGGPVSQPYPPVPFQPSCTTGDIDFGTDLLIGKTLTASGNLSASCYSGNLINDGDDSTTGGYNAAVEGAGTYDSRWEVDFGSAVEIGGFRLYTFGNPITLHIEYSNDDSSWTDAVDAATVTAGNPGNLGGADYTFTPITARYWGLTRTDTLSGLAFISGVDVHTWSIYGAATVCNVPDPGQYVPPEQAGIGDGATTCFFTNYPYQPGSLVVQLNGVTTVVTETDPTTGEFCFATAPPTGAVITVSYTGTGDPGLGTGNPSPTPVTPTLLPSGTTLGDILVWNGSAWTILPVGTDTYVLTADSGETLGVQWEAGGGGGGSLDVTDGSTTVSSVTEINFTSGATVTDAGGGVADVDVTGGGSSVTPAPAYVQHKEFNSGSFTMNSTPTSGNTLLMVAAINGSTQSISAITQTNVSWSLLHRWQPSSMNVETWIGTVSASASASGTLTETTGFYGTVWEITGQTITSLIASDDYVGTSNEGVGMATEFGPFNASTKAVLYIEANGSGWTPILYGGKQVGGYGGTNVAGIIYASPYLHDFGCSSHNATNRWREVLELG